MRKFVIFIAVLLCLEYLLQPGFSSCQRKNRPKSALQTAIAKPNIVLVLASDLGYGDLASYGSSKNLTPQIDQLAKSGVRFIDFHSASAVCSLARIGILTGRSPARFGNTRAFSDIRREFLHREVITLPELLKEAGYATAHIGKWHIGGLYTSDIDDRTSGAPGPLQHGFDHYLAMKDMPAPRAQSVQPRSIYRESGQYLFRDDKPVPPINDHLTEIETAEAENWIETFAKQRQPFFVNVWFTALAAPYEPSIEQYLKPHEGKATGDDLFYRSMITHLDGAVGRLVAKLKQLGIAENTLLIFTSDNGATGPGSSAPLRGGKGTLFEGGIRVPMIAVWPGKVRAGAISNEFAISTDLLPTICEAAGISLPRALSVDGRSLLNHLKTGRRILSREVAFWLLEEDPKFQTQYRERQPYATEAVRWGPWKLLARDGQPLALYYLENDLREQRNLIDQELKIRDQMVRELRAWLSTTRLIFTPLKRRDL